MAVEYRKETDSIGEKKIPKNAYYGIQSLRAKENFSITKIKIHKQLIKGLGLVKKAAIISNNQAEIISDELSKAIVQASDEVISGKMNSQFIVDGIQGGAGTSMNMNVNEIIANRSNELLGHKLGNYFPVHPNDHCNFGQSTNDVVPTSGKIAVLNMSKKLIKELKKLHKSFLDKAIQYRSVIKMGRTHLQDAVPISMGQEFGAYASVIERDIVRIKSTLEGMLIINMGATAVGTGLNADEKYIKYIIKNLNNLTGYKFKLATDLVDGTRNLDNFVWVSGALKTLAVNLSKTANDLRLMASGPKTGLNEIFLPMMQPGSSIMPGKVNPVIPEVVNQISFQVFGNDLTITKAAEAGQLELNVFEPVLFKNLLESIEILTNGIKTLREKAIEGLIVNSERCISYVERSPGIITALAPHLGYEVCSDIAKEAIKDNVTVINLILKKKLLSKEDLDTILNVESMTTPGIAGEQLLKRKR